MTLQRAVFCPLALLFLHASLCSGQPTLKLVAGGSNSGDGIPAAGANIGSPDHIAVDSAGNLYIWDTLNSRIRKVNTAGIISTIAAATGQLAMPVAAGGLAIDSGGNLYIADTGNYRVRKVDTSGVMTTIAGNGTLGISGTSGNGSQAVTVALCSPSGVAVDRNGNVYFGSSICGTVRKVDTSGVLSTVASTFSGTPFAMTIDTSGNLYVCDRNTGTRVYKVAPGGAVTVVAGTGISGFSGDGGPATSAQLFEAHGVAVDAAGNVYVADGGNFRVRKVDTSGTISTVAGGGTLNAQDGSVATSVKFSPQDVTVDASGNLYISAGGVYKVSGLSNGATPSAPPAISANGVVNGASFQPGVAANSWVTIQGTNLAGKTDDWSHSIVNGALPTSLDGVSVTMGGKPAYIYFVSPGQLNVLAPDVPAGPVSVTVTTAAGTSTAFSATAGTYGPAFFLWPNNQVVATRQDFSYAAQAGTFPGATTVPAKPGDVLILWATGFGPTQPSVPIGVSVPASGGYPTASSPAVTINNTPATVYGAALAPGSAGLYQIAVQVPPTLADGDWPIQANIGGVSSPAGTILSVHH
ncbi:MAG TPA: IPT/TIG domain-containing protein [Candidatus Limnocylindrales bacterium]|nr:IPT/TIG domain-containing protein [Candidatus Limnocylindrales bacterium]